MTELQQEGVLSTLPPEQTDKLFHSPAMPVSYTHLRAHET